MAQLRLRVGALVGHLRGRMSNTDLREIGEMLDDSEAMQMEAKRGQTILKGEIVDQPRLHGILDHIGALGLKLMSVEALSAETQKRGLR